MVKVEYLGSGLMQYVTRATRARIVDAILDAMLDVGDLDDEHLSREQKRLLDQSMRQLKSECELRRPGDWRRLVR